MEPERQPERDLSQHWRHVVHEDPELQVGWDPSVGPRPIGVQGEAPGTQHWGVHPVLNCVISNS